MPKTRLLIADDHALVRAGLRALLTAQPDLEVVGEAVDGVEVVEECRRLAPDLVLLDLRMPGRGGIQAIEDLRQSCAGAKVLVVTMHEDEVYARQALQAGARGYVLKKSGAPELIRAIRTVLRGQPYISASVAVAMAQSQSPPARPPRQTTVLDSLTVREREVLSQVALGYTNAEVADRLHISQKTVESHRKNLVGKLGLRSRADLVRFAIEHGLMS